jgi:prepilin-type N-terminal cleavage/methylation domain-containing protein
MLPERLVFVCVGYLAVGGAVWREYSAVFLLRKVECKMEKRCKRFCPGGGFTIVEMLTTIAIIAILVSLLLPALNMVRRAAAMVKQKAQFNSIGFAL